MSDIATGYQGTDECLMADLMYPIYLASNTILFASCSSVIWTKQLIIKGLNPVWFVPKNNPMFVFAVT